ncbi:peptidyl-prolyl cis-trans isomerase, partial [bacterium]|nr:peptidyl-prolyl cis-trans isomerase [bacterium]
VVDGPAPFPYEWFSPGQLGIRFEDVAVGLIPEPYGVPGGWVVARVTEIEEPQPVPLEECRTEVLTRMKSEFISDYLARVMARLEEATEITILPGAEDRIRAMLEEAVGR